ncbi:DNase1 protein [Hypoxylon sp. NC1633]|nr:DNase1 protein [Hypoxylon sp. NC1633]
MRFTQFVAYAAGAASLASANSLTFINQDSTTRHIVFTASAGHEPVDTLTITGNDQQKLEFPVGWVGNAYSYSEGKDNVVGMLAEVTFQGWNGITYYDVSAIVNPYDHEGVKQMYPSTELQATEKVSVSGCTNFPCGTAYYVPDDIQTVTTYETDLVVTLGNPPDDVASREAQPELVPRHYVLGKLSA